MLLAILMTLGIFAVGAGAIPAAQPGIIKMPYSAGYQQYLIDLANGDVAKYGDLIPEMYDLPEQPVPTKSGNVMLSPAQPLPAKYDLRNVDGQCYVSAVKNQGSEGLCWDFAAVAALESACMKQGLGEMDFSENQYSYFVYGS